MLELMYDIASGSTYKFNTGVMGEMVRPLSSAVDMNTTRHHTPMQQFLVCWCVACRSISHPKLLGWELGLLPFAESSQLISHILLRCLWCTTGGANEKNRKKNFSSSGRRERCSICRLLIWALVVT